LVGRQEGHPACKKTEWWGAGAVICLERGADLHMAQLTLVAYLLTYLLKYQYKLCMIMRRCQDGTAPRYLTAHWAPGSETASRQHLRRLPTINSQFRHIGGSHKVVGRSLSLVRRRATHCRHVSRDSSNSASVFGRLLETFLFSEN